MEEALVVLGIAAVVAMNVWFFKRIRERRDEPSQFQRLLERLPEWARPLAVIAFIVLFLAALALKIAI